MHQSSRSRGKNETTDRRQHGVRVRKQMRDSKSGYDYAFYDEYSMDENSIADEFRQSSSKRTTNSKAKGLTGNEAFKRMGDSRSSPSLIARLMGLDTTPPRIVSRQEKSIGNCFPEVFSAASQGSYLSSQEHFSWKLFKDVFEVETSSAKKHKRSTQKEMIKCSKCDTNECFMRQKFTDSTAEALQPSNEFDDAFLLEFLQDHNPLFRKHVRDLKLKLQTSNSCQITVLRPSKGDKSGRNEPWKTEKSSKQSSHLQNEIIGSSKQHSLKNHSHSSRYNSSTHALPSPIVILKPNLHKGKKSEGISLEREHCHLSTRKNTKFTIPGIQELHREGRERGILSDNVDYLSYGPKSSREIAREITRQMRQKVSNHSKNAVTSEFDRKHQYADHFDEWFDGFGLTLYSTASSVKRDVQKCMSERRKTAHRFQQRDFIAGGSSTHGRMHALPDRLSLLTSIDSSGSKKATNEIIGTWDFRTHINNKDGWKDGSCKSLRRSKSLSSATVSQSSKLRRRKQVSRSGTHRLLEDVLNSATDDLYDSNFGRQESLLVDRGSRNRLARNVGADNMLPEQEIRVSSKEQTKGIHARSLSEENPLLPDVIIGDEEDLIDCILIPTFTDKPQLSICRVNKEREHVFQMPSEIKDSSSIDKRLILIEETSMEHLMDPVPLSDAVDPSHDLSKDIEQLSPVSVLEPPFGEESSSSGSFESLSVNLRELRMQLKLLKLKSRGSQGEETDSILSSDDESTVNALQEFRNADDRDFSYLLDMLTESGFRDASHETVSSCCYSRNSPVGPHIFDRLEKKYGQTLRWSKAERKLLFDITNGILEGMVSPCTDLRPWAGSRRLISPWKHDSLAETVWTSVVKHRKELLSNSEERIFETKWLFLEDGIEEFGKEFTRMINDELLEELVSEFLIR